MWYVWHSRDTKKMTTTSTSCGPSTKIQNRQDDCSLKWCIYMVVRQNVICHSPLGWALQPSRFYVRVKAGQGQLLSVSFASFAISLYVLALLLGWMEPFKSCSCWISAINLLPSTNGKIVIEVVVQRWNHLRQGIIYQDSPHFRFVSSNGRVELVWLYIKCLWQMNGVTFNPLKLACPLYVPIVINSTNL